MKIVCFGSMNIDYVYDVDHIVTPGETLESSFYKICSGGKGLNQAIALARSNATCYMAGILGKDGAVLLSDLSQSMVNTSLVKTVDQPSGHTIIQVDRQGQNSILYFGGANKLIDQLYIDEIMAACEAGDYILLQNEIGMVAEIMFKAKAKGLKIAFNPSPINPDLLNYPLELVDLLILNEHEGQAISGEVETQKILEKLIGKYPDTDVLLTLGSKGAIFKNSNQEAIHGVYDVKVIDTTGAGDTFTGYFLKMYAEQRPIEECLKYASVASSIAVTRQGAAQSIPVFSEVQMSRLLIQPD